jgi:uncharacterized membrane protein
MIYIIKKMQSLQKTPTIFLHVPWSFKSTSKWVGAKSERMKRLM